MNPALDHPAPADFPTLLSRWLLGVGLASLLLRCWIAATFPISGDEALFYWWGVYPDWGYSDHPPMAGWLRAERREQLDRAAYGLYALAGLFLGCAFLSKYFSVVLGFAYLVYFVFYRRPRLAGFALLVLCALPGPAINIAYNMSHGWS